VNANPISATSPYFWIGIGFTAWMLLDATRRRVDWFWYLVALLTPFIYFLMVKLPNNPAIPTPGSEVNPTIVNGQKSPVGSGQLPPNLERADQLEEAERYDEAMPIYRESLEFVSDDLRALHGMARCELGLGHPSIAVTLLEKVLNTDREYRGYAAALDYADALWLAGQKQDTLELLDGLVHATGRPNHRLAYAYYLAAHGDLPKAQAETRRVIDEHSALPQQQKQDDQHWRDRAEQMLTEWSQLKG